MIKFFMEDRYDLNNSVQIWITEVDSNGRVMRIAEPFVLTWREYTQGQCKTPPTIELDRHDAAPLFDSLLQDLAKLGYKLEAEKVSDGQLQALKLHLEDMRIITFDKLGINRRD